MLTNDDLQAIRGIVKEEISKELKPVKKDIRTMKADINILIGHFDKNDVYIEKSVRRLETHLGFDPLPRTQI